jgi:hypothetical protein
VTTAGPLPGLGLRPDWMTELRDCLSHWHRDSSLNKMGLRAQQVGDDLGS